MAFVCDATWVVKEGRIDLVREALRRLTAATREEPGNRYYQPHQAPDEPAVFRIFEVYDDEAAFEAHAASDHFRRFALGIAIPQLESRTRAFSVTLDV
ncbi:putative quinol monooxygenase [Amnibacterium sp.]|uniref:putative quinol monooxygenase n=1 Tax=Amnibacterium sp. TaxID=1872496 RepID=UPI00260A52BD|nr:putative quinol monooxygenase [Amnibacterium sp.]MCU1472512.1 putative monooxygenase YcnE [Amnibacterium sp.]